jgi:threonine dehydratase
MEFTYADVCAARPIVERHLPPTPQWSYPLLDREAGAHVLVKHENVQPVGAFKVRGGVTLLDRLPPGERELGTITYSTGNHALSMAYASSRAGVPCTVVMPAAANPGKAEAVRAWGADVVLTGADLAAAQAYAERVAEETGVRLVSPGDTPELLAGVGTLYQEIFTAAPDLDAIVVPVGSGTGAAAAVVVARELAPNCAVIAVQSTGSPAAHDSWASGHLVERPNRSRVDGLATGRGFALPQRLLGGALKDFVLVTDDQIAAAQRLLATHAHTLAEGAGAAGLAAVIVRPDLCRGRRIAIVCTGGNASPAELADLAVRS